MPLQAVPDHLAGSLFYAAIFVVVHFTPLIKDCSVMPFRVRIPHPCNCEYELAESVAVDLGKQFEDFVAAFVQAGLP